MAARAGEFQVVYGGKAHPRRPLCPSMISRNPPLFAAVLDPVRWLDYPIVRLGDITLAVFVVVKVLLWIATIHQNSTRPS